MVHGICSYTQCTDAWCSAIIRHMCGAKLQCNAFQLQMVTPLCGMCSQCPARQTARILHVDKQTSPPTRADTAYSAQQLTRQADRFCRLLHTLTVMMPTLALAMTCCAVSPGICCCSCVVTVVARASLLVSVVVNF
jgi:hypothetical protein